MDLTTDKSLDRISAAIAMMGSVYNCGCGDCNRFEAAVLRDLLLNHDWASDEAIFEERVPLTTPLNCHCPVHPNPLWVQTGKQLWQAPKGWKAPKLSFGYEGPSEYYTALCAQVG